MSDIPLLRYQRVRYVGPRFPTVPFGAEGHVSDRNNQLSTLGRDWLYVNFGPLQAECRIEWLEAL